MAIYVDPSSPTDGDGTISNPRNTLNIVNVYSRTVLLKCGTQWYGTISEDFFAPGNVTLGVYGTGDKPVISGARHVFGWRQNSSGIYEAQMAPSDVLGNVTLIGKPLKWVALPPLVNADTVPPGRYACNPVSKKIYVNPYDPYFLIKYGASVSTVYDVITARGSGLKIDGIVISGASRHACHLQDAGAAVLSNIDVYIVGGYFDLVKSIYLGNGIEVTYGCDGTAVSDYCATHVFDSAGTSQLYHTYRTVDNHLWQRVRARNCGMAGIELSDWGYADTYGNVAIDTLAVEDIGQNCFGGDRGGAAIWAATNTASNVGEMTGLTAKNVFANRAQKVIRLDNKTGVMQVQGIAATNCGMLADVQGSGAQLRYKNATLTNVGGVSGNVVLDESIAL